MMKDKLVKHNHKFVYFIFRRIAAVFVVVFGITTAITVPTYISINSSHLTEGKAEKENDSSDSSSSSSILEDN